MAKDYYNILGVDKKASPDEIKKAFRKHAQKYHPDKPSGDEAKFKEVNEAYSVLSNEQKRAQYDQFGQTFADGGAGGFGGQGAGGFSGFEGFDFSQFTQGFGGQGGAGGQQFEFDLGDIFGSVFGGGGRQRRRKGRDIQVDVTITFKESIFGVQKKIQFQRQSDRSKENFEITIPQGIDSGEMLRVHGKGEPIADGDHGDLYVRIHVTPHKTLHKDGYHLVMDLGVKLTEAILGTKKEIETLDGTVTLKIPAGVTHGELLRIKGKGVPIPSRGSGDLLVRILIPIPEKVSGKARDLVEELQKEGL